jgi:hypothetical protein
MWTQRMVTPLVTHYVIAAKLRVDDGNATAWIDNVQGDANPWMTVLIIDWTSANNRGEEREEIEQSFTWLVIGGASRQMSIYKFWRHES